MTRGRRKDTTIPPSRALIIQRAYRDRKAKYLSDLEDRCRNAEEENERLRKELELARSESGVASINSELARLCTDLMQNLVRTQKALSLFQQRAFGAPGTPQDPCETERTVLSATELDIAAVLTHALRQDPFVPASQLPRPEDTCQSIGSPLGLTADDDDSSGCCGGLIDCEGLIE
ncbi:hypothetical protein BJV78DRAFT_1188106 [Lactifluus subvellereus]|nr:hypothetical protein BJV78DRAFT_1188106 [Lactifluus subvellereus]